MAEISLDTEKEINAAEMKKPEARVSHVSLKDVSLEHVTYNAKVSFTNPFSTPVPILEISYALKTANRFVFVFPFHFHSLFYNRAARVFQLK